jgi:hypothetical protein
MIMYNICFSVMDPNDVRIPCSMGWYSRSI